MQAGNSGRERRSVCAEKTLAPVFSAVNIHLATSLARAEGARVSVPMTFAARPPPSSSGSCKRKDAYNFQGRDMVCVGSGNTQSPW